MKYIFTILFSAVYFLAAIAFAQGSAVGSIPWLAEQYLAKLPIHSFRPDLNLSQAMKAQEKFVELTGKNKGREIGYKVGLTNQSAQARFGVSHPLRGVLLKEMLLKNGSVVSAAFGAAPMCEGDLIVMVGSDTINQAVTVKDVLANLDAVIPFMELPDLVFAKGIQISAPMIAAINVGARYGIVGEAIPIALVDDWDTRLKDFTVRILDKGGNKITGGKGANLLGNPLKVVLWLRDSLKADGKALKKGDLISLGTITAMVPVKQGFMFRAVYEGLDPKGAVELSVSFE